MSNRSILVIILCPSWEKRPFHSENHCSKTCKYFSPPSQGNNNYNMKNVFKKQVFSRMHNGLVFLQVRFAWFSSNPSVWLWISEQALHSVLLLNRTSQLENPAVFCKTTWPPFFRVELFWGLGSSTTAAIVQFESAFSETLTIRTNLKRFHSAKRSAMQHLDPRFMRTKTTTNSN